VSCGLQLPGARSPKLMPIRILARAACTIAFLPIIVPGSSAAPSSHFIQVNGVRLEYLDWGGNGEALIFLAGLGDTPYIYNDLAPEFRFHFRCLGLTRRGYGRSAQPESGYELDSLVQDIASFVDALHLRNVTVVGHSFGGTEAIRLSELHPEMLRRVILLDTAYDLAPPSVREAQAKLFPALVGMPMNEVLGSLEAFREFQRGIHGNVWSDASEANLHEQLIVNGDGSIKLRSPARVEEAILRDGAVGKWKLTRIPVTGLLIFAHNPMSDQLSRVTLDASSAAEIRKASDERENARRGQIEAFRRDSSKAQIVEFDHTDHRCFIQRREEVLKEMKRFLRY